MNQFEKDLEEILKNDPLGLLAVKAKQSNVVTADQRLVASFEEINTFVRQHGREPEKSTEVNERRLYSRLRGIRDSSQRSYELKEYDELNLLKTVGISEPSAIESIEDILNDDALGLLGSESGADPESIFSLRHVPRAAPSIPYRVATRKACKEFDRFEPLFLEQHALLRSGVRVTVPFKSEQQISKGEFFILDGIMVHVANIGKLERRSFGNYNARLLCIFENGTESNMLLRSLAAALWKDSTCRQVIDAKQRQMYDDRYQVNNADEPTGYIYILRSQSEDPKIREIENLYKIGFSRQTVLERIAGAADDPTFLMADVALVTHYETFNLNPQQFEKLIHRFFAKACLNLDIIDASGKRYTPREWFVVPLPVIENAIKLLISGDIVKYEYNAEGQTIISRPGKL